MIRRVKGQPAQMQGPVLGPPSKSVALGIGTCIHPLVCGVHSKFYKYPRIQQLTVGEKGDTGLVPANKHTIGRHRACPTSLVERGCCQQRAQPGCCQQRAQPKDPGLGLYVKLLPTIGRNDTHEPGAGSRCCQQRAQRPLQP